MERQIRVGIMQKDDKIADIISNSTALIQSMLFTNKLINVDFAINNVLFGSSKK